MKKVFHYAIALNKRLRRRWGSSRRRCSSLRTTWTKPRKSWWTPTRGWRRKKKPCKTWAQKTQNHSNPDSLFLSFPSTLSSHGTHDCLKIWIHAQSTKCDLWNCVHSLSSWHVPVIPHLSRLGGKSTADTKMTKGQRGGRGLREENAAAWERVGPDSDQLGPGHNQPGRKRESTSKRELLWFRPIISWH